MPYARAQSDMASSLSTVLIQLDLPASTMGIHAPLKQRTDEYLEAAEHLELEATSRIRSRFPMSNPSILTGDTFTQ